LKQSENTEPIFIYNPLIEDEFTDKSPEKIIAENNQVRKMLEDAYGSPFYEEACKLFELKNHEAPDKEAFKKNLKLSFAKLQGFGMDGSSPSKRLILRREKTRF
jgi:hypothetical protein